MSATNIVNGISIIGDEAASALIPGRRFCVIKLPRFELTNDGSGGVAYNKFTLGFRGRIIGFQVLCDTVTSDTNADGTMSPRIGGTIVTQATKLTLADVNDGTNPCATVNKLFQGTVITAADKFAPGDVLDLLWTTTNAFSDGAVTPFILCELYEA